MVKKIMTKKLGKGGKIKIMMAERGYQDGNQELEKEGRNLKLFHLEMD